MRTRLRWAHGSPVRRCPLHHAALHAAPALGWHRLTLPVACICRVQLFFNQAQLKPDSAGKLKKAVPHLRCTACVCRLACSAQQAARRASPTLRCSLCVLSILQRRSVWPSSFLCAAVPHPPGAAAPPCLHLLPRPAPHLFPPSDEAIAVMQHAPMRGWDPELAQEPHVYRTLEVGWAGCAWIWLLACVECAP